MLPFAIFFPTKMLSSNVTEHVISESAASAQEMIDFLYFQSSMLSPQLNFDVVTPADSEFSVTSGSVSEIADFSQSLRQPFFLFGYSATSNTRPLFFQLGTDTHTQACLFGSNKALQLLLKLLSQNLKLPILNSLSVSQFFGSLTAGFSTANATRLLEQLLQLSSDVIFVHFNSQTQTMQLSCPCDAFLYQLASGWSVLVPALPCAWSCIQSGVWFSGGFNCSFDTSCQFQKIKQQRLTSRLNTFFYDEYLS